MTTTVAPPTPPATTKTAGAGIALVLVAQLMIVLDSAVVNVALPRIARDLEFTPAALTWVLNGYTLAFGGLLLLGGRLGDVFGRRRTFVAGLSVFTLFSLAGGFAPTDDLLVAARALQGFGAAIAAPQVLALLTTSAKDEAARAKSIALFAAVSSSGASIGLILGGILTDVGSWRWTLLINVPIGLVVLALVSRLVSETARRPGRFDVVGAVTATGGAAAIVWSLIGAPEHGWTSARTIGGIAVGLLLLVALVLTERRVAHPLLQLHLFNSHRRVTAFIAAIGLVGAQFSTFYLTVIYLQGALGMGPLTSGLAFLPLSLTIFAMSRVSPRIAARIGMPGVLVLGAIGLTLSFLLLSTVSETSSYAGAVLVPFILNGAFASLVFTATMALGLEGVDPAHAGAASGLVQTTQQLGGSIGLAVIASVYVANGTPGEVVPGMREAFYAAAALASIGIIASLTLVLRRPSRTRSYAPAPVVVAE
ncbi:EmrB/QacA subfamily drug resistance transporter [Nocardioides albertanoniae]|uniref:EmrB/QacA subfamily drug resistance transporter n=1 Tax=Nocardioides albertanoniae TaxID=1175486 RepID=A0A543A2N7_9ACTN|nr:MFS transporter [Nocardioides albertanoniae]TQL66859.1 EmrB/QacA subfamily drug resistance transporter [Nocardioides albertanoniae]